MTNPKTKNLQKIARFASAYIMMLAFLLLGISCQNKTAPTITAKKVLNIEGKQVIVTDYEGMKPLFEQKDDSIYVINFWATWCVPCVGELPYFDQLLQKFQAEKLSVSLVSLDFSNKLDKSLIPFLKKKKVQSNVLLLDDKDANTWINKINPEWSGALPATIIYSKNNYAFFEKSFTYEELETAFLNIKNNK